MEKDPDRTTRKLPGADYTHSAVIKEEREAVENVQCVEDAIMCPCLVVCLVAVYWRGIVSFIVLVTMFGCFSLPCCLFLLFLPVVSSVELIEGSVISLCVVSKTSYTGAEFPSQVHSSCQNPS